MGVYPCTFRAKNLTSTVQPCHLLRCHLRRGEQRMASTQSAPLASDRHPSGAPDSFSLPGCCCLSKPGPTRQRTALHCDFAVWPAKHAAEVAQESGACWQAGNPVLAVPKTSAASPDATGSAVAAGEPAAALSSFAQMPSSSGRVSAAGEVRLQASAPLSAVVTDAVQRWHMETSKEALKGDVVRGPRIRAVRVASTGRALACCGCS